MIVKSKYVSARKVAPGQAASALKSHLKYLQYRERGQDETREDRQLFSKDTSHVDRKQVHDALMRQEPAGDIYYHRLILSPSQDEPVQDYRQWTRDIMHDLEQRQDTTLTWYATIHQNTDNPHVHVVLSGTGRDQQDTATPVTFSREDFQTLRESGRDHSQYEYYRQIDQTFTQLDQDDQREQQQPERNDPAVSFPDFQPDEREVIER